MPMKAAGPAISSASPNTSPICDHPRQGSTPMPATSLKSASDTAAPALLDFYATSGRMTCGGARAALLEALPRDVASLMRIVQGLVIHEYASSFYGVDISQAR